MLNMENYLLLKRTEELEKLSKELGFTKTYFLEDLVIIKAETKKELLKMIKDVKKKKTIFRPVSEELLRFALERTKVDMILGAETINPKDSVHFVRGGLDQITCKIAAAKKKGIGFSFSDILNSKNQGKLLARMKLNLRLCKKYKVDVVFSNFSNSKEEIRAAKDLKEFLDILKQKQ